MPRLKEFAQTASTGLLLFASALATVCQADEAASVDLAANASPPASRVRAQFNVGGDLTLDGEAGEAKLPMSVVANLSYREQPLPPTVAQIGDPSDERRTIRYYDQAHATIKIDKGGVQLDLPDDRRQIVALVSQDHAMLVSPSGPLTREQLDLIAIPAGTHVLDRLLPGRRMTVGDTWKHDEKMVQLLLDLDKIDVCEVESVLIGVEQGYAKMRLAGAVYGNTDGAATEIEIKAGYLFDTRQGRITRMNLAFSEKREAGRIGPAVDVVGRLTLEVGPLPASDRIPADQLAAIPSAAIGGETRLLVESRSTGLVFLHDRHWHITSEGTDRMVLRRIDGGDFVAQCIISVRPERQEGRQATLAEFERDVRFSLGDRFESLVSASEWTSAAGLLCYRMVVHGKVDDLPVEWRYYLASPAAGRSVAMAVSVEPRLAEVLGDADKSIVETIHFLPASESEMARSGISAGDSEDSTTK